MLHVIGYVYQLQWPQRLMNGSTSHMQCVSFKSQIPKHSLFMLICSLSSILCHKLGSYSTLKWYALGSTIKCLAIHRGHQMCYKKLPISLITLLGHNSNTIIHDIIMNHIRIPYTSAHDRTIINVTHKRLPSVRCFSNGLTWRHYI